jgi:hypothetical protein
MINLKEIGRQVTFAEGLQERVGDARHFIFTGAVFSVARSWAMSFGNFLPVGEVVS